MVPNQVSDGLDLAGAAQFYQEMEDLRMDLFVIHLEHPRQDEKTLIKL